MAPRTRRFALVVHVGCSVGWLGAVATSVVLGVVGLVSSEDAQVRAGYLVLDDLGWWVLVPLSLASLVSGLIQSLGTTWGLLRHYWVLAKLSVNVFATAVLLLYMQTLDMLAAMARTTPAGELDALRSPSPVVHAGAAIVLLVIALVLSIYKPRGVTGYGRRTPRIPVVETMEGTRT